MNIVLIQAHAVGRNLSVYGRPVDTPHLLRFARRATVFRNAFSVSSVASPAKAALLCGQLPHLVDVLGPVERGFRLAHTRSHLAHTLGKAGFLTVQTGGQSIFSPGQALPYARVLDAPAESALDADVAAACAACSFLEEVAKGGVKQPFFLSCAFALAHRPFAKPPEDAEGRFCGPADGLPDTPRTRADFSAYRHTLSFLDGCVGQVLETLERTGRLEDTVVVFTTDHGAPFPLAEGQLSDRGIGVALLMHVPQNPSAGAVSDALVSHLDVYPTLCDWAGVSLPQWLIGHSLRPIFERRRNSVREELVAQTTYGAAYEPLRCIRTLRYKLVKSYDPDLRPVAPNIPDGPSKDVLFELGWALHERSALALYDVLLDPGERRNLIDDPALWSTRTDLLARMEGHLREMGDPLMRGFVPPPAGARLNRRSQRSASEETYVA